jgi:transposase
MHLVEDYLWEKIAPLLPPPKARRSRCPGRLPLDNRITMNGILFILKTNIPWESLTVELGFGSGITCWRRLREWRQDGTWSKLFPLLLSGLRDADAFDWSRVHVTRNIVQGRKRKVYRDRRKLRRRQMGNMAELTAPARMPRLPMSASRRSA